MTPHLDVALPSWDYPGEDDSGMRIISRRSLKEFWQKHPDSEGPLRDWYKITSKARWNSIADTRRDYPHADPVGACTVFNIAGNKYRLVTAIIYGIKRVYVRNLLTHAEYNKDVWKKDCGA